MGYPSETHCRTAPFLSLHSSPLPVSTAFIWRNISPLMKSRSCPASASPCVTGNPKEEEWWMSWQREGMRFAFLGGTNPFDSHLPFSFTSSCTCFVIFKTEENIYNGILLSHKKEQMWVSWTEVDEPRACFAEWNESEREKQMLYIKAYIWNLEKWCWWTYLQAGIEMQVQGKD